jgi:hypothetical protein
MDRTTSAVTAARFASGMTFEEYVAYAGTPVMREWRALQLTPFFPLWASAAIDEMLSGLHERLALGPPA